MNRHHRTKGSGAVVGAAAKVSDDGAGAAAMASDDGAGAAAMTSDADVKCFDTHSDTHSDTIKINNDRRSGLPGLPVFTTNSSHTTVLHNDKNGEDGASGAHQKNNSLEER